MASGKSCVMITCSVLVLIFVNIACVVSGVLSTVGAFIAGLMQYLKNVEQYWVLSVTMMGSRGVIVLFTLIGVLTTAAAILSLINSGCFRFKQNKMLVIITLIVFVLPVIALLAVNGLSFGLSFKICSSYSICLSKNFIIILLVEILLFTLPLICLLVTCGFNVYIYRGIVADERMMSLHGEHEMHLLSAEYTQ